MSMNDSRSVQFILSLAKHAGVRKPHVMPHGYTPMLLPQAHVPLMCAGAGAALGAHSGQRGGRAAAAALLRGGQLRGAPYVWRAGHRARARRAWRCAAHRPLRGVTHDTLPFLCEGTSGKGAACHPPAASHHHIPLYHSTLMLVGCVRFCFCTSLIRSLQFGEPCFRT